jgi:hypothetical protein
MFPGPGAQVYYNEAREPIGWDYPSYDPPELDPIEESRIDAAMEDAYEQGYDHGDSDGTEGLPPSPDDHAQPDNARMAQIWKQGYEEGHASASRG